MSSTDQIDDDYAAIEHDLDGYRETLRLYTSLELALQDRERADSGTRFLLDQMRREFAFYLDVLVSGDLFSDEGLKEAQRAQVHCKFYKKAVIWFDQSVQKLDELADKLNDATADEDLPDVNRPSMGEPQGGEGKPIR